VAALAAVADDGGGACGVDIASAGPSGGRGGQFVEPASRTAVAGEAVRAGRSRPAGRKSVPRAHSGRRIFTPRETRNRPTCCPVITYGIRKTESCSFFRTSRG